MTFYLYCARSWVRAVGGTRDAVISWILGIAGQYGEAGSIQFAS